MKQGVKYGLMGILGLLAGAGGAVLATGSVPSVSAAGLDRAGIEKIVREYILTHPEILPEAMHNLERKEAAQRVKDHGDAVTQSFGKAWEGAENPDVTLVEFFDYACGYCRSARPDVEKLVGTDAKVRVVYRELPILGPDSVAAARVSLAVAKMGGNYGAFHKFLFASGRPTPQNVDAALAIASVDAKAAHELAKSPEIAQEISNNLAMQQKLGLSGTPSWVIGDQLIGGAVGYDELKAAVAETRREAKGTD
jgi:protein-disulfide isomerase